MSSVFTVIDCLTYVTEGGTHDDGLVPVLLVVVEDTLDRLDTRVFITLVVFARFLLIEVKDLRRDVRL